MRPGGAGVAMVALLVSGALAGCFWWDDDWNPCGGYHYASAEWEAGVVYESMPPPGVYGPANVTWGNHGVKTIRASWDHARGKIVPEEGLVVESRNTSSEITYDVEQRFLKTSDEAIIAGHAQERLNEVLAATHGLEPPLFSWRIGGSGC